MLIHRVSVIGVVQGHAKQSAKFRDESAEHAAGVHFAERLVNALLPAKHFEKMQVGLGGTAKIIVNQTQVGTHGFARLVAQLAAVLLRVSKEANEVSRSGAQDFRLG